MNNSSEKQVALITGANKGIGYEVARQLGRDGGMTVLLGCRDEARGQEAADKLKAEGLDAHAIRLDVADLPSVQEAAAKIGREFGGRLDVLVNNAGVASDLNPPSQTDLDKFKATHATNVFGPLAVTTTLLPFLRKSPAGRIVNVSSSLGSLAGNSKPEPGYSDYRLVAYNSSKAALNMQTVLFAAELAQDTPIKVNSACPGYCATDLNNHQGTRTVEEGSRVIVRLATLSPDGPTGGFFNDDGPVSW